MSNALTPPSRAGFPPTHDLLDGAWRAYLAALLELIGATFIPLMQQNTAAYQDALAAGETLFNEAAFDQGRALYDGELLGYPFRSVAKRFQVPVWRDLCTAWRDLDGISQANLSRQFPTLCHTAFEGS